MLTCTCVQQSLVTILLHQKWHALPSVVVYQYSCKNNHATIRALFFIPWFLRTILCTAAVAWHVLLHINSKCCSIWNRIWENRPLAINREVWPLVHIVVLSDSLYPIPFTSYTRPGISPEKLLLAQSNLRNVFRILHVCPLTHYIISSSMSFSLRAL